MPAGSVACAGLQQHAGAPSGLCVPRLERTAPAACGTSGTMGHCRGTGSGAGGQCCRTL